MTPAQTKAQFEQAQALIRNRQAEKAVPILRGLLLATGQAPQVNFQLSRALDRMGDTKGAANAIRAALDKMPNDKTLIEAGIPMLSRDGDNQRVLDLHDRRIAAEPDNIDHKAQKALFLQQIGEIAAGNKILRDELKKQPRAVDLYRMIVVAEKLRKGDPLIREMKRLWLPEKMKDHALMSLGFALAKAHEDIGETDKVFAYLDAANAAQGRMHPASDPDGVRGESDRLLALQDYRDDAGPTEVDSGTWPIFVVGMPRSGTTLIDQIIGAHSKVTSGGELAHALRQHRNVMSETKGGPLRPLSEVPQEALDRYSDTYMMLMRRDTGATEGAITDKAMNAQRIFGQIAKATPSARFIVVHRDPRAIALSIYKNHFTPGTHTYATSLPLIAEQIKLFRDQVAYWRERLPNRIHEVHYEDLVADPEPQTRALIAACGLDWEDACLSFHDSIGTVKTLSIAQVRQPINAARREAWRQYEKELAPFIEAWGDTPWDVRDAQ